MRRISILFFLLVEFTFSFGQNHNLTNSIRSDLKLLSEGLLEARKNPVIKSTVFTRCNYGLSGFYHIHFSQLRDELLKVNINLKDEMNLTINKLRNTSGVDYIEHRLDSIYFNSYSISPKIAVPFLDHFTAAELARIVPDVGYNFNEDYFPIPSVTTDDSLISKVRRETNPVWEVLANVPTYYHHNGIKQRWLINCTGQVNPYITDNCFNCGGYHTRSINDDSGLGGQANHELKVRTRFFQNTLGNSYENTCLMYKDANILDNVDTYGNHWVEKPPVSHYDKNEMATYYTLHSSTSKFGYYHQLPNSTYYVGVNYPVVDQAFYGPGTYEYGDILTVCVNDLEIQNGLSLGVNNPTARIALAYGPYWLSTPVISSSNLYFAFPGFRSIFWNGGADQTIQYFFTENGNCGIRRNIDDTLGITASEIDDWADTLNYEGYSNNFITTNKSNFENFWQRPWILSVFKNNLSSMQMEWELFDNYNLADTSRFETNWTEIATLTSVYAPSNDSIFKDTHYNYRADLSESSFPGDSLAVFVHVRFEDGFEINGIRTFSPKIEVSKLLVAFNGKLSSYFNNSENYFIRVYKK